MRIRKEETAALVIDFQEKLFPFIFDTENLTKNTVRLIKGLKLIGIKLFVTEQYSKGLGHTVETISEALGDYSHIEKSTFSCCGSGEVRSVLKKSGAKNIIVFGIEAHVCVLQTTIDLIHMGYKPVLIEDCVSSRNPNDKKIAVERMSSEGAVISTYESILFELCEVSGTDTFKSISKIVK
jgi:nicotinamidase-related amidase